MSAKQWMLNCGCVVAGAKPIQGFKDDTPKRLVTTCLRHTVNAPTNAVSDPNKNNPITDSMKKEEELLRHYIAKLWSMAAKFRVRCCVMFVPRSTFFRMQCCFDRLKEEPVKCREKYIEFYGIEIWPHRDSEIDTEVIVRQSMFKSMKIRVLRHDIGLAE